MEPDFDPRPAGFPFSQLSAVACIGASNCWAVGGYERPSGATVDEALYWNGAKWKLVATPTPGSSDPYNVHFLTAVACTSQKSCWAVGGYAFDHNQAVRWNTSRWSEVRSPTRAEPANASC